MSKVIAVVVGGTPKELDLNDGATLADVRKAMEADGYQASINGDPENDDSTVLDDYEFVSFAAKVKGAAPCGKKKTVKGKGKGKPAKK